MPLPSEDGNGFPVEKDGNPESFDMAFVYRKSAMDHAWAHLRDAYSLEELSHRQGHEDVYIQHATAEAFVDDARAILLTRDGETPVYEIPKELMYVYFPPHESDSPEDDNFPYMWVEYHDGTGNVEKYSLTHFSMNPYEEGVLTEEDASWSQKWGRFRRSVMETVGLVDEEGPGEQTEEELAMRFRDFMQNFRLTPQKYNPFSRYKAS